MDMCRFCSNTNKGWVHNDSMDSFPAAPGYVVVGLPHGQGVVVIHLGEPEDGKFCMIKLLQMKQNALKCLGNLSGPFFLLNPSGVACLRTE